MIIRHAHLWRCKMDALCRWPPKTWKVLSDKYLVHLRLIFSRILGRVSDTIFGSTHCVAEALHSMWLSMRVSSSTVHYTSCRSLEICFSLIRLWTCACIMVAGHPTAWSPNSLRPSHGRSDGDFQNTQTFWSGCRAPSIACRVECMILSLQYASFFFFDHH